MADEAQRLGYELADDDGVVRFSWDPTSELPLSRLLHCFWKQLNTTAEECLGSPDWGRYYTVLAYFDDAQRQATKDAAK